MQKSLGNINYIFVNHLILQLSNVFIFTFTIDFIRDLAYFYYMIKTFIMFEDSSPKGTNAIETDVEIKQYNVCEKILNYKVLYTDRGLLQ